MDKVILVIGIVIILEGILLAARPDWAKKAIKFFCKGRMIYLAGVLRLIIGVLFLVSARECTRQWVIIAFGVLLLVSGVVVFVTKLDKLKAYLSWWYGRSLVTLRLLCVIVFAIGGVIVWAAW